MELGDILISEREIAHAVEEIAAKVCKDYDPSKLVLVGAMDGAVCFLADLMRWLATPVAVTTVRMRRYEGTEGGELTVSWLPLRERIEGRDVLIVEGVVDTGATCALLVQKLRELGSASVNICALLNKPARREHDVEPTYCGFDVPDVFVVGYGLDYMGEYRNLRDVHVLEG